MKNLFLFASVLLALVAIIGGLWLIGNMFRNDTAPSGPVSDPFGVADPFGNSDVITPDNSTNVSGKKTSFSEGTNKVFTRVETSLTAEEGNGGKFFRLIPSGTSATSSPFAVLVSREQSYVQITIYGTPVGKYRRDAESFFLQYFNLSEEEACDLPYQVVPAYDTGTEYTDMNIGFSFCPGSVVLREI